MNKAVKERKLLPTLNKNRVILRSGDSLSVPESMSLEDAILLLQTKREEEKGHVGIFEEIHAFPLDGAVALHRVIQEMYDFTAMSGTKSMFGYTSPQMLAVEIGFGQTLQVSWGKIHLPGVEGFIETKFMNKDNEMPTFVIGGEVARNQEKFIHELADMVRDRVKADSIYRGRAIKMNYRDSDGDRIEHYHPSFAPKFLDVSSINVNQLVFPESTSQAIDINIFTPIRGREICKSAGIPLKTGVLLVGGYGTGKTLTAHIVSRVCEDNGWTFLYIQDARDLDLGIRLGKTYGPCVVFCEDVDKTVGGQERTDEINQVLNTIDGVDSKEDEIMVILTTNHVEDINAAFLRPGRIDVVIKMEVPDSQAIVRLVQQYGGTFLQATHEEIIESTKGIAGQNAALVRETVERSKRSAIRHMNGDNNKLIITPADLKIAAESMAYQVQIQQAAHQSPKSKWDVIGGALIEAMPSLDT